MADTQETTSWVKRLRDSKVLRWVIGIPVALVILLYTATYFLEEPLRSSMEKKLNQNLKGYSVQLQGLNIQWLGLSVTLKEVTVLQQSHPEPPLVHIPVLKASIHWREVLAGKLVAEFLLDRPKININLQQLRSDETESKVALKERGWQQAVQDIYPLKINSLKIIDATITYIDQDPKKPLILSHLNLHVRNIRNIQLPDQVYPSSFHLDTAIFGSGYGSIDGQANFLAEPYPAVRGRFVLEKVPVEDLNALTSSLNLFIEGGVLHVSGNAEYSPTVKLVHLENLTIQGMKMDYVQPQPTAAEKKDADIVEKVATERSNKPGWLVRAVQVSLMGCTLGVVNEATSKPYRIFLADTDFHLSNFSNRFSQGPAQARLKGKFMGSGETTASAEFRPEKGGPDLDLAIKIEDTELKSMNDVLRSYGDFDVSAGYFSLVMELHVKNEDITGYIKPFFKDMKVYNRRTDKERGFGHQMYEMLVGGVSKLLENRSQQEVATKADITGRVENPETSTWQIVAELIKNAFFKAILPSFEKEAAVAGKR